jgi:hypothetical protein
MTVSLAWTCSRPAPKKPGKLPRDPLVDRAELELGCLGLLANRVDGGKKCCGVDTV